ncbi:MAG TPA: hypothetical protein VFH95_05305 [Candidatus Kapabacteria bacterium]|nr:hypothetical protein [Candidatus Kapabacteria bacterium]
MMTNISSSVVGVRLALKRLRSPDFERYDASMRRIAWDSIISSGTAKELRKANEARDANPFPATSE